MNYLIDYLTCFYYWIIFQMEKLMKLYQTHYNTEFLSDFRQKLFTNSQEFEKPIYNSLGGSGLTGWGRLQPEKHYEIFGKPLNRLFALPVAVIDIATDFAEGVVRIIQHVALAVFNILGALFSEKFSLKDAVSSLEAAVLITLWLPVKILFAPVKIALETLYILKDPVAAKAWGLENRPWT